jgi:AraC-like DNA-binding protein
MRDDDCLLDICARLLQEPQRLLEAGRVPVEGKISIPVHSHDDILQMDLAVGCGGHWTIAGDRVTPRAATATAFYPRVPHGYAITAVKPGAEICNFKLRVDASWPAVKQQVFPALLQPVPVHAPLHEALRRTARLFTIKDRRPPLLMAALVEVLCLWPRGDGKTARSNATLDGHANGAQLEPALKLIDERLNDPPGLKELAAAAHLSSRHFVRRFQNTLGCSPFDYATARRLDRARQLLSQGRTSVTQAAEALGFPSIHTFSRWFKRETGRAPQDFRERPDLF